MKNTKRILLSIITLVLVVVALGTTTFAWFTLSNVATISDIEAQVTAGEGLEIALGIDGKILTDYKTNLTSADWKKVMDAINGDENKFKFGAVSTTNGATFSTLKVFDTKDTGKTILEKIDENKSDLVLKNNKDGYLEFTIHFKSNTPGNVKWTNYEFTDTEFEFSTEGTDFTPTEKSKLANEENKIKTAVSNAARIAVVHDDNNDDDNKITIVQKDEGVTNTVIEANPIFAGQFSYLTSKGNVIHWDDKEFKASDDDTALMEVTIADAQTSIDDVQVATLEGSEGNYTSSVTVRVWLEGWDPDTFDALFNQTLKFNLEFRKEQPA